MQFCQCLLQKTAIDPNFPDCVLFTDGVPFTGKSVLNTQNSHFLAFDNLQGLRGRNAQQHFTIRLWTLIIGDSLLGSYLLPPHLINAKYLSFLETFIKFSEVFSSNMTELYPNNEILCVIDEPNIYNSMDWLR